MDVAANEHAQMDLDLDYGNFDLGFDFSATPTQENVSQKNILEFIESQKKQNTKLATERDLKRLKNWLKEKGERREIQNIPVDRLNWLLAEFYISVRKNDGSDYEPTTLEAMENSIERYLKDHDYGTSFNGAADTCRSSLSKVRWKTFCRIMRKME